MTTPSPEYPWLSPSERAALDMRDAALLDALRSIAVQLERVVGDDCGEHLASGIQFIADALDETIGPALLSIAASMNSEAERVYDRLAETGEDSGLEDSGLRALAEWVRSKGPEGVTARQLAASGPRQYRGDRKAAQADLDDLAEMGGFRWRHPKPQGGRPPSPRLVVNADIPSAGADAVDVDADIAVSNASSLDSHSLASTPRGATQ